jgi:hypothetical protein
LRKINTEIATGPCLPVEPKEEQSGSTAPPTSSEERTPAKPLEISDRKTLDLAAAKMAATAFWLIRARHPTAQIQIMIGG